MCELINNLGDVFYNFIREEMGLFLGICLDLYFRSSKVWEGISYVKINIVS